MCYMESKYLYGAGDASNMAPFMVQHPDVLLGGFVRDLQIFAFLFAGYCDLGVPVTKRKKLRLS